MFMPGLACVQRSIASNQYQFQWLPLRNRVLSESDKSEVQNGFKDIKAGLQCTS